MPISKVDFYNAPSFDAGMRQGFAPCRICDKPLLVYVEWCETLRQPVAYSSGSRPGCTHPKCGDKMPAVIDKMATEAEATFWDARWAFYNIAKNSVGYSAALDAIAGCETMEEANATARATSDLSEIVRRGK